MASREKRVASPRNFRTRSGKEQFRMDHCATTFDVCYLPQRLARDDTCTESQAAMVKRVHRYVDAHLCDDQLSPESVLSALQLPRSTLYRLFQHEGGLGAYIRDLRLRHAADDLIRYPHALVLEIAFGLGFKSASVFTRAFRRAYGMAPQEYRALAGK